MFVTKENGFQKMQISLSSKYELLLYEHMPEGVWEKLKIGRQASVAPTEIEIGAVGSSVFKFLLRPDI